MKKLLLIAMVLATVTTAAVASLTKTTDHNWLTGADEETRAKRLEHYLGGFSAVMLETGLRYGHVEEAIAGGNWELAHYHWEKIADAVENGLMKRPARRPNAEALFLDAAWGELDAALKEKERGAIEGAFRSARRACMECHSAEGVAFINDQPLFGAGPLARR